MEKDQYKLCYVKDCWAYFTAAPLDEQWGDDWNDAPYEHNAGSPYEMDGYPPCLKVAFDANMEPPCALFGYNSPFSVEGINLGRVPWLASSPWEVKVVVIYAGTTLARFKELIKEVEGDVYERVDS